MDNNLLNPVEDRKTEKGVILFGAILSILIGICVLIFFIKKVSESHSIPYLGQTLNLTNFGAFGDFIAGVVGTFFSLAGFFLLYLTLQDQRHNFHRERLESTFFELIKLHRDNVNEMQYSYFQTKQDKVVAEKRKVFKIIFTQYKEAWDELNHIFTNNSIEYIYDDIYLAKIKSNKVIQDRQIDLKELAQIDIIYLIVFYGLGNDDKQVILNLSANRYKIEFVKYVLDFASLKPKKESDFWLKWELILAFGNKNELFNNIVYLRIHGTNEEKEKMRWVSEAGSNYVVAATLYYPDIYDKYYGGHQFRLGHYFRHIYQTIKFIDDERYLSKDEKYNYIKILRGQLSNYEQIVFFLNSISKIGHAWEIDKTREDDFLITKYNLIKNIPMKNITSDINILKYYPNVKYESIFTT